MLRLIMALGVAAMLMPEDVSLNMARGMPEVAQEMQVSTHDTFSAAYSVYEDLAGFCQRNEETCITGKALAARMANQALATLNAISAESSNTPPFQGTDPVVTSGIENTAQ